ncbi:MAG: LacI family DNA-binding transcriptional regulator [Luteolibacter sp.]
MRITRKDIAKAAGVSASTVAMILSGSGGRYSAATRRLVMETAEALGYQKSIVAKALQLRRSLLIGVLFSEVNAAHAPGFLRGVQSAIAGTDYSPLIFFTNSEAEQTACFDHCVERRVDALLVNCTIDAGNSHLEAFAERVRGLKVPVLEIFGSFLSGAPQADIDNASAGATGVAHLVELGHRDIALITHSRYTNPVLHHDACDQAEGYQMAMIAAGLKPVIVTMDFDYEHLSFEGFVKAGVESLAQLVALTPMPTAAICYSDLMAYGLNRACRARGMKVPEEFSILGNGDLLLSAVVNPPLSTMRLDSFQLGLEGARRLLVSIDSAPLESVKVKPELLLRQSTGPAPTR